MIDRKTVESVHRGRCAACGEIFRVTDRVEMHHAGVHNTQGNRENYPRLVHSTVNILPMHAGCHANHPGLGHFTTVKAEALEEFYEAWERMVQTECDISLIEVCAIQSDLMRMWREAGE